MAYKLLISSSNNPFYNLALEEYLLENLDTSSSDYLLLYWNTDSVIVGRNQNIFEEVNLSYCKQNQIEICRRISGGGTVFHFSGNLNWCNISSFSLRKVNRYDWAAEPIMTYLENMGLKPYLTERNAIEVAGWKLSGQAQFTNRKNVLSHGTLLIEPGQARLQAAIEASKALKIRSKASSSVRSKTSCISDILNQQVLLKEVLDYFRENTAFTEEVLPEAYLDLAKFMSHEWIWQRCPNFYAMHNLEGEELELQVSKDKIIAVKNEKGHLLVDSPFLNQTYESFLESYG